MGTSITPRPVVKITLCSLCEEPWEDHGKNPTAADCIRLLKAKLAITPAPITIFRDRYPYYPAVQPYWTYTTGIKCADSGNVNQLNDGHAIVCYNTPADVTVCAA